MKILVLGSTGFIGSNLCNFFKKNNIKFDSDFGKKELNLLFLNNFKRLINSSSPKIVINCLGVVGGIQWGLSNKVKIFEENNQLTINLLKSIKGKKIILINLLANCIYPYKFKKFYEKDILNGPIHPSVIDYGMSRRMLYTATKAYSEEKLIDFINLIPSNVYGQGDHFDPHRSHALGALISKFYNANKNNIKEVEIWGTGSPKRDWLFIDDLCRAILKVLKSNNILISKTINISSNQTISIRDLANRISNKFKYNGKILFNKNYPDGDPIKSFDNKKLIKYLGFQNFTDIDKGLEKTINYLKKNENKI